MSTKSRTDWKKIWDNKGDSHEEDLTFLNGHENAPINPKGVTRSIIEVLDIQPGDQVLEVGAGAGMIAQYLECIYTGCDYSESLCNKHRKILNNEVVCCEADKLPFANKSFDKVFSFSVFHYFPDHDYALRTIKEMERVAKSAVFISDLPLQSHDTDHLLYTKDMFEGWNIHKGLYRDIRFNISKKL